MRIKFLELPLWRAKRAQPCKTSVDKHMYLDLKLNMGSKHFNSKMNYTKLMELKKLQIKHCCQNIF